MAGADPSWPTMDARYEVARDAVIEAEHDVSRAVKALATRRRALPRGSLVRDYKFEGPRDIDSGDQPRRNVRKLSDLDGVYSRDSGGITRSGDITPSDGTDSSHSPTNGLCSGLCRSAEYGWACAQRWVERSKNLGVTR